MINSNPVSGYSKYNPEAKSRTKINPSRDLFPPLPDGKYDIIYADPPWDYGGKMQYDKSCIKHENIGFAKDIFISAAIFKYPTLKIEELKALDVRSLAAEDSILFLWTTGPQMDNALILGKAWGFEYKTVAFVWDKKIHNPGHYTLSQTEFVLAFKRGKFPAPRGARNVRQLVSVERGAHSEKPEQIIAGITEMFPGQRKIELFARKNYIGWDNWGLEIPDNKIPLLSAGELNRLNAVNENPDLF